MGACMKLVAVSMEKIYLSCDFQIETNPVWDTF